MATIFGLEEEAFAEVPVYIVSNHSGTNGASAVLSKGILRELAKRFQVHGLTILPSSIHEMLIVPCVEGLEFEGWSQLVAEINRTQVRPEERLTDRAYQIIV